MIHCECYALRQRAEWKKSEVRIACKIAEVTFQKMIIRTLKIWTLFRSNLFANNSAGIQAFLFFGRKFWSLSTRHWCLRWEQLPEKSRKRWLLLSSKPEKSVSVSFAGWTGLGCSLNGPWAWFEPGVSLQFFTSSLLRNEPTLLMKSLRIRRKSRYMSQMPKWELFWAKKKKRYQGRPRRRWSWLWV